MPSVSSSSARVTFLDVPSTVERLRRRAQALTERDANTQAVVLFGSLAEGSATPSSDADLMVVLGEDPRRVLDRIPDYTLPFENLGLAVQVLPWTRDELRRRLEEGDPFARQIVRTGQTLAGALSLTP